MLITYSLFALIKSETMDSYCLCCSDQPKTLIPMWPKSLHGDH
jgi:hypothetical protein